MTLPVIVPALGDPVIICHRPLYRPCVFCSHNVNKQSQHTRKSIKRAFVNLTIGKQPDQRKVAQHGIYESSLF